MKKIIPKYKSDVQFNGYEKLNSNWSILYSSSINKEFSERYNKLMTEYDQLINEIQWNNLIYNTKIRFKPVIGKSYYLYIEDNIYFMSLISPNEWKKEFVGEFKFDYNGKWNKI